MKIQFITISLLYVHKQHAGQVAGQDYVNDAFPDDVPAALVIPCKFLKTSLSKLPLRKVQYSLYCIIFKVKNCRAVTEVLNIFVWFNRCSATTYPAAVTSKATNPSTTSYVATSSATIPFSTKSVGAGPQFSTQVQYLISCLH